MVATVMSASCPAVPVQHLVVVHLVDVVAREDQGLFRRFGLDALKILKYRVRRPLVPVLVHALHGRQHFDVFAQLRRKECSSRRARAGSGPATCTVLG